MLVSGPRVWKVGPLTDSLAQAAALTCHQKLSPGFQVLLKEERASTQHTAGVSSQSLPSASSSR